MLSTLNSCFDGNILILVLFARRIGRHFGYLKKYSYVSLTALYSLQILAKKIDRFVVMGAPS